MLFLPPNQQRQSTEGSSYSSCRYFDSRSKEVLMTVLNSNSTFFWTTDHKQNVISFIYNRFTEVSVINQSCYLFHAFSSKMVCFTTLVTVEY